MKLLSFVILCGLAFSACKSSDSPTAPSRAPDTNVSFSATDLRAGTGATATTGRLVNVRYTLWAYSTTAPDNKGTQLQSSSFSFTVGSGVIQGFSMGVNGMQVGGIRRIVIPPSLGYGDNPPDPSIRRNETLLFEVELLSVQ